MEITLLINNDPNNKINKSPTNPIVISGTLRNDTNMINPVILVDNGGVLPIYNYVYIPDFKRYYFVDDIEITRNNIVTIYCKIDVLKTYADEILKQNVIISRSTNNGTDYLSNPHLMGLCKDTTNILTFPAGLNDNGEFILITAGG